MKSYIVLDDIRKYKSKVLDSAAKFIDKRHVKEVFRGHTRRRCTYNEWTLFQLYLNQSTTGISCTEAVAWGIGHGLLRPGISPESQAYSNSRNRLPEDPLKEIMTSVGRAIEKSADGRRRPFGRNVVVADGTSVQLPDTPANQREYPQPTGQKPGCGQPVMYLAALMGLQSGAILDVAAGGGVGHERALFRELWTSLNEGDIVITDNGLCSYADFAKLLELRVDVVMAQRYNALENKELIEIGKDDYIVIWERGKQELKWADRDSLPEHLVVRAVRFIRRDDDGVELDIILFTTLLDRRLYPRNSLIDLYRRRWEIEISLKDIKITMGLDLLKRKRPERCRSEVWMGLLAYNIIRGIMLDAARRAGLPVRRISFQGTIQRLNNYFNPTLFNGDHKRIYDLLLDHIAADIVPDRPGRHEPRKRKRRDKNYRLLTEPRNSFIHAPLSP